MQQLLIAAPLTHSPFLPLLFPLPFPSPQHSRLQLAAVCTLPEVELIAPTKTSDRVCGCPTASGFYVKGSGDEGTCTPCTTCADTEYVPCAWGTSEPPFPH